MFKIRKIGKLIKMTESTSKNKLSFPILRWHCKLEVKQLFSKMDKSHIPNLKELP